MTMLEDYSAAQRGGVAPLYLNSRYDASGRFLPDPGNTIVCHLVSGSETERALLEARRQYLAMPDAGKFAFTAPDSLHMTLFQGILDRRRVQPYWPHDMACDLPVATTTENFLSRLDGFEPSRSFAVELKRAVPTGLVVDGVTAADRHALADWRNRLAERMGYRHPDHDHYEFHITFAYPIEWIAEADLPAWRDMLESVTRMIRHAAPRLELRAPAFCSFEDMNWFEELLVLDGRPTERRESA